MPSFRESSLRLCSVGPALRGRPAPEGDVVAPATVRIANPWSPDVLRGNTILTPDRGHMENVKVKGGEESSVDVNGKSLHAKRYEIDRLDGAKRYEVWLDDNGTPV